MIKDLFHADPVPAEQQNGQLTAEQYEAAVGHPPHDDDLERANCPDAGKLGHWFCGWDHERNLPEFIAIAKRLDDELSARALASPNDEGKAE